MTDYGMAIFPQHAELLAGSLIPTELARSRGYVSADTKTRLKNIQISGAGCSTPGLIIPLLRKDGSTWGHQYRPDSPRSNNAGKPVKYETPWQQRNGIDVPPGVGPMLDDPSVPLFVTEGTRKADCAAGLGLACIALPGVWSWRGKNAKGGKTAIADWHDVALNDRRVILAFDSDVVTKPAVATALRQLADYLTTKGAKVEYLHLPNGGDGKTGLDDYISAGHTADDLWRLVSVEAPSPQLGLDDEEPAGSAGSADCAGSNTDTPTEPVEPAGSAGSADCAGSNTDTPTEPARSFGDVVNSVRSWLATYIYPLTNTDLDVLTLWIMHTHFVYIFYTSPRLLVDSPVAEAGKTTVIEHCTRLCLNPLQAASLSSPALLPRMLNAGMRTILIDEAEKSLRPDKPDVGDLLAVVNSGYKRGATRPVLVPTKDGWEVAEMPTFAPVAMAGISPALPDDTMSRCIKVLLLPDSEGIVSDSDWEFIDDSAKSLAQQVVAACEAIGDEIKANGDPELPDGVRGRMKEKWRPLKRVADAAGGNWPQVCTRVIEHELEVQKMERDEGMKSDRPEVALLRDIVTHWPERETFWSTVDLVASLKDREPDRWGPNDYYKSGLTVQRAGRILWKAWKVRAQRESSAKDSPRGYRRLEIDLPAARIRLIEPCAGSTGTTQSEPAQSAEPAEPAGQLNLGSTFSDAFCSGGCGNKLSDDRASMGYDLCPDCHAAADWDQPDTNPTTEMEHTK